MCKTLPVLFVMGNSLRSCCEPKSKVSLKGRVQSNRAYSQIECRGHTSLRIWVAWCSEGRLIAPPLINGCGRLQVDLLPLALYDSGPNLGCRLTLLMLLIGVIQLLQAG